MRKPGISVIIVAEQGGNALNATLASLQSQRLPAEVTLQVVVVYAGPAAKITPPALSHALLQMTQPEVLFGHARRAAARNRGTAMATGDLIVFLEEGLVMAEGSLAEHWNAHATAQRVCVVAEQEGAETERCWLRQIAPWALVDGSNLSLRRDEFERAGGYDVTFAALEPDDAELGYRLCQLGVRLVFTAATGVRWSNPPGDSGTWRGRGLDYIGRKHPELGRIAELCQLENDTRARCGLVHSDAYQRRLTRWLSHPPTHIADGLQGWTLGVFADSQDQLAACKSFDTRDRADWPAEIIVIASRPSTSLAAAMAKRAADVPVTYRPFREGPELGEIAFLRLTQRRARPQTVTTQKLMKNLESQLAIHEQQIRQAGLRWAQATAQGSIVRFWKGHSQTELMPARVPTVPPERPDSNCLPAALERLLPRAGKDGHVGEWADGYSYPPRAVSLKLTHLCNLRCEMCGQWGPVGNARQLGKKDLHEQMVLQDLGAIIDEVAEWRPGMIYLWGGEPFLHPDFLSLVRHIRRQGLYCLVTTNGTLLSDAADELVASGLHTLRVSLDGPPKVHDRIRGRPGTFADAMAGIQLVQRAKAAQGTLWPFIQVFGTISPSNYADLNALIDELELIGVDSVGIGHMMYVPRSVGERHQEIFYNAFGVEPVAWRGFMQDVSGIDIAVLHDQLKRLQSRSLPFPIVFEPPLRSLGEIEQYYRDPSLLFPEKHCRGPWMWAEIHPNGDMSFCDEFPDYVLGNALQRGVLGTWNGERARRFRREVLARRRFPICTPCHLLHLGPAPRD